MLGRHTAGAREHPWDTVDVVIFTVRPDELGELCLPVLPVKRGAWPYADLWAIPGGAPATFAARTKDEV